MSQNPLTTPTSGSVSGMQLSQNINAIADTLVTNNSGSSEPTSKQPGMFWVDTSTTPWTLKMRNAANTAWTTIGPIDKAAWGMMANDSSTITCVAGGTADALTGDFTPDITTLTQGLTVLVRAGSANTSTTPTFKADGTAAKTIVKGNNLPLQAGDIAGAGHWLQLTYDTTLGKWVLENPASGVQNFPAGAVGFFAMMTPPSGWIKRNGAALSRTTYAALFNAITLQTTGNTTSGSNSISSVGSTANIANGMPISGPGIPAGTTVTGIGAGSITISQNATATASGVAIVVAPYGVGDGSTTFNVPEGRAEFDRGWDDGRGIDSGRVFGSAQASQNLSHSHTGTTDAGGGHTHTGTLYSNTGANSGALGGTGGSGGGYTFIDAVGNHTHTFTTATSGGSEARSRNVAYLACIKY